MQACIVQVDKIRTGSGATGLSGGLAGAHWKCDLIFASKGLCFVSDNDVRIWIAYVFVYEL